MPIQFIESFRKDIKKFNQQRIRWLILSSVVVLGSIVTILTWREIIDLHSKILWWTLGITGITLSLIWWYWTTMLVKVIIDHQFSMIQVLDEITIDIKVVKRKVAELQISVD